MEVGCEISLAGIDRVEECFLEEVAREDVLSRVLRLWSCSYGIARIFDLRNTLVIELEEIKVYLRVG